MTIGTGMGASEGRAAYERGGPGDTAFKVMAGAIAERVETAIEVNDRRIFTVDTEGLWQVYLDAIEDPVERQGLNCHCYHDFIRRYGGLVSLSDTGVTRSIVWGYLPEGLPDHYYVAVRALREAVDARPVKGEFLWKNGRWGTVEAGGFTHFHVSTSQGRGVLTLTDNQEMAARREDHKYLSAAVGLMKPELVERAVGMLEAGELIRSDTLLPMGTFLRNVQRRVHKTHGEKRSRILWHAVSEAARGWCSPRGSAFGALVEDIESGVAVSEVVRRHNVRLDPQHYQRPKAPPSAGNVAQAEKLFELMELAPALRRRPMALEEAELIWKPRPPKDKPEGGVFGHLVTKDAAPAPTGVLNSKPTVVTFVKFRRDVLPKALGMTVRIPAGIQNFCALTTAVVPEAPPLLKWDRPEKRNPAAWYVHVKGSHATEWGLSVGAVVEVLGVSMLPAEWYGTTGFEYETHGLALFVLKGAADTKNVGLGLFPQCLRGELHGVRATLEAHSNSKALEDEPRQRASGLLLSQIPVEVSVRTEVGTATYRIDRIE